MIDKIAGLDVSHEMAIGGSIALIMLIFGFAFLFGIVMIDIIIPWIISKITNAKF